MQRQQNGDRERLSILVIEDEELLRDYLCDYLNDTGFLALQAPDGVKGMAMIRATPPDIVLTDLRMPEMNGLEVLSAMQQEFPETPVIVLSGTGTLADVVQSMKLGAWDYILKPLHDYSILDMSINRVLERKRLITENTRYRTHLEEEVAKRTDELIKSTYRFKTLFNLAGDAIFIYDVNGVITDFNQQALTFTGYSRDDLLRMNMRDLLVPQEKVSFGSHCEEVTANTQLMFETAFLTSGGTLLPAEVNASLITMDETPRILAVCRNISERKKAEEERKRFEKQLVNAQKMESLGLLASGIAHDFNNILAALNGYAMLLKADASEGSEETEYLQKINEIVVMGQKLTGRITNFIRKEEEELAVIDFHKVLADTCTLLKPSCREVLLQLDLQAENVWILGDETQLQNAFLNLGINAIDAMPTGGTLRIGTTNTPALVPHKEWLSITVSDTGTGMNPDTLYRIFDPLFTTKERGKGTGLGLTSVLYCINNLHGEIDVESTPGNGTTFTILLPTIPGTGTGA
ncbi:MAG: response regulator [Chitinispirillaceae bacterium]|nr:response regulator [Chitinispirillaceae bacterium]